MINYVDVDYDNDGVTHEFSGRVLNVGQTDGEGAELSTTVALGDHLTLYLAGGYLDTEATGLQDIGSLEDANGCEGSSLFWAPEITAAGKLDACYPMGYGTLTSSFECFYEDERGGSWEATPRATSTPSLSPTCALAMSQTKTGMCWPMPKTFSTSSPGTATTPTAVFCPRTSLAQCAR